MLFSNLECRLPKNARLVVLAVVLLGVFAPVESAKPAPRAQESATASLPQQEEGWIAIKTEQGILFVWNEDGLYFSLSIKGKEIKPLEDPAHIFFGVDGHILQIQRTAIKIFAPDAKDKKLDDKAILAAHRDWEAKYIEDLLHSKLAVRTFNARLSNGAEASMWQFDMPQAANLTAQKELYLTLVAGDFILMLNSEATAEFSDADGRKFLLDTIATLKVSPTPIDVKKLIETIHAGNKP
jgi:hypothetical protein